MKESMWGVFIVGIGVLGILLMSIFIDISTTNEQNYYLLKESATAAMYESVDLAYYREYGELKIDKDKFAENFARRYAESASKLKVYDISLYDIQSLPPKASVKVTSNVAVLPSIGIDTFEVTNTFDIVIEAIKDVTENDIAPVRIEKISAKDLTIYQGEKEQLIYSISPGETTNKNVTFEFIDGSNDCATIDSNGIVTGVEGKYKTVCTRTVRVTSGGKSTTALVTVKPYITVESIKIIGQPTDGELCDNQGVNLLNYLSVTLSNGTTVTGKEFVANYEEAQNLTVSIDKDSGTSNSHVNDNYFLTVKGIGTINYTFTLNGKSATGKINAPNCSTTTTTTTTTTKKIDDGGGCSLILNGSYLYSEDSKGKYNITNSNLNVTLSIRGVLNGNNKVTVRYSYEISGGKSGSGHSTATATSVNADTGVANFFVSFSSFADVSGISNANSISVTATATSTNGYSCTDSFTIYGNEDQRVVQVNAPTIVYLQNGSAVVNIGCRYKDGSTMTAATVSFASEHVTIDPKNGRNFNVTKDGIYRAVCHADGSSKSGAVNVKVIDKTKASCKRNGPVYECTYGSIVTYSYDSESNCLKNCMGITQPTTAPCVYSDCKGMGGGKYLCTKNNVTYDNSCSCESACKKATTPTTTTTCSYGKCTKGTTTTYSDYYRCSKTNSTFSSSYSCTMSCKTGTCSRDKFTNTYYKCSKGGNYGSAQDCSKYCKVCG